MSAAAALRHSWRTVAIFSLALLLAACGFHLRGQAQLPAQMQRTYIAGLPASDALARALTEALSANGVRVVSTEQRATAVLQITSFGTTRTVASMTASGQISGYRIVSTLIYAVRATHGGWQIPSQQLQVQRQYSYSDVQVLGKSDEAAQLREDMSRQLANLVLLRLQARARVKP